VGDAEPRTIDLDPRSAVAIAVAVIGLGMLVWLVDRVPRTVTGLVLASLIALALEPIVKLVERRLGLPRRGAVATVLGGFIVLLVLFGIFVAPRAEDQFSNLDKQAPRVVRQLDDLPVVGKTMRENHVPKKIEKWIKDLPDRLAVDSKPLEDVALAIADGFLALFLTILLAITLLLDAEQLTARARALVPPARLPQTVRFAEIAHRVIGRYVAGSLFTALCAGTAVLVFGLVLGVPLAPLAAAWVCMTNLVPQIGGALGGIPFVVLGFTDSATTGVLCAALFITYQLFENHVLGPLIQARAVKLAPPLVMATVLIGVAAGGVVGALIAVPLVGAVRALYVELRPPPTRENAVSGNFAAATDD
jgi:predicted PurR-regulated permease PerM